MNIANRIKKLEKVEKSKDDTPFLVFRAADPSKDEELQRTLASIAKKV